MKLLHKIFSVKCFHYVRAIKRHHFFNLFTSDFQFKKFLLNILIFSVYFSKMLIKPIILFFIALNYGNCQEKKHYIDVKKVIRVSLLSLFFQFLFLLKILLLKKLQKIFKISEVRFHSSKQFLMFNNIYIYINNININRLASNHFYQNLYSAYQLIKQMKGLAF